MEWHRDCNLADYSMQLLLIATNETSLVEVIILYSIYSPPLSFPHNHTTVVQPHNTTVFDLQEVFLGDIDELGTNISTIAWIDQPVQIKTVGHKLISVHVLSSILNSTSLFPTYPLSTGPGLPYIVITEDESYLPITDTLKTVPSQTLTINFPSEFTDFCVKPSVNSAALYGLSFEAQGNPRCLANSALSIAAGRNVSTAVRCSGVLVLESQSSNTELPRHVTQRGETFTNTIVHATKPIQVYAGRVQKLACSPSDIRYTVQPIYQVLDTSWGYTYIVFTNIFDSSFSLLPFTSYPQSYYEGVHTRSLKYIINTDSTEVGSNTWYVWNSSFTLCESYSVTQSTPRNYLNDVLVQTNPVAYMIRAHNFPITLTMQLLLQRGPEYSTLFTVPPVEQYRNQYIVPDPRFYYSLNKIHSNDLSQYFLTIVVPAKYLNLSGTVVLDGSPVENFIDFKIGETLAFVATRITPADVHASHTVRHTNPRARIGVQVFGFTGSGSSMRNMYAFAGGSLLQPVFTEGTCL